MMPLRFLATTLGALLLGAGPLAAEEDAGLDEAIETMLSVRESDRKLEEAIEKARSLGARDQAILEARFLYHVDRREDGKLAALLPQMIEQGERFEIADSEIFAFKEDWLAVLEYVKAVAALEKGDRDAFKEHITDAFWLSPRQGTAFAPYIERVRTDEAMKRVRVDRDLELKDLSGRSTTLKALAGDSEAVLLHFFSPWSRECEESIDDLRAVTAELAKHKIPVIGIVGEGGEEAVADTVGLLESLEEPAPGAWLVDHPKKPLSRLLRIQSAPTMILVDAAGKVRFNGHPSDDRLWKELSDIAPGSSQPAVGEGGH